jgi:pyrimidine operon attenuation protein / uracil phosphoribosyltransferase
MHILGNEQIEFKVKRLAYEILENNYTEKEIILAGINNNGYRCADLIYQTLSKITDKTITITHLNLNPAKPTEHEVVIDLTPARLKNKVVIIVDDVANTGRTLFYAFKVLMDILPKKVQVAALVDRKHKLFPIAVDYVGLSLATTIREHIKADLTKKKQMAIYLE